METSHRNNEVNEARTFACNSKALSAREFCNLLINLKDSSLRSGKKIVSLAEKTSRGKIQKVKEYLGSKGKKSGSTRKESMSIAP
jgi:hypothetical protein